MACSDNVVRAGLTPKFKDVDCLLSMLQYEPRTNNKIIFPPKECSIRIPDSKIGLIRDLMPTVFTYAPPVEEFAVDRICIPAKCEAFHLFASPSASILIIISGSGRFQVFLPKDRDNENPQDPRSDSLTEEKRSSHGSEKGEIVYAGSVNQMIDFHRGMVFFVHANVSFSLHPATPNSDSILAFRAYANVDMISQSEDTIYDKTSYVVLGQARQM
ncbi:Mannose-6-phosphate isomerase [Fasciola gigantica]|uniref:Mannose-6-phosphate isomerase n=1 Tax=Fasciola gigantica TaxID=46835 RepID=A0A504YKP8_FASGI|nr:Mannose-6-phosphate isomerase [Fasciola gigantica]